VYETIGHKGSNSSEVVMEDCRIPKHALIGEEGKGFDYAKRCLAEGRTGLAARSVGAAQKAMELALEYGSVRKTFGLPLNEHQVLAFRFAQMSARTEAARLCVYRSAWLLDQGLPAIRESSTAKLLGGEWSWQTVDECFQIFGGNAYIHGEYMIERIWRDLRVARIYDGSSEVQQMVISQQLRKGNVQTAW
jgi:acyl-CoA dehydrogenase